MTAFSSSSPPTLLEKISHHARTRPGDLALAFVTRGVPDEEIPWRDLDIATRRLGGHLQRRGMSSGDVVLVLSASPREQTLGFLGAMAAGGVPTILSFPSVKQSERRFLEMLGSVVENSQARWILASAELSGAIERWIDSGEGGEGQGKRVELIGFPDLAALEEDLREPGRPEGHPLFLQFSSGTTGARKGIAVTLEMFAVQASAYGEAMEMGPADRIANWLPLYHDNGLVGCFLLPLYMGSASIHLAPFDWVEDPASIFETVHRYRATLLWSPNFAFSFCARRIEPERLRGLRLDCLRAYLTGGELVRESSRREFLERFAGTGLDETHLQVCYGMAENTFVSNQTEFGTIVRKDVIDRRAFFGTHRAVPLAADAPPESGMTFFSCGRPLPNHQVRIGGATGDRQVGEIEILSGCLFEGYLSAGAAGAAERVSREGVFTADGWYRSGDQGYIVDGELFCTGRLRDLIIHRGVNLHPDDLQEVIGWLPGVKEGRVAVFGVADEEEGTERIVAMLEPEGPGEAAEGLERRVREEVSAAFGVNLQDVRICEPGTLLKTTSGKVSRKANRSLYLETLAGAPQRREGEGVGARDPWEAELVEIWRKALGVETLGVTDDLFLDLGASSLTALSAVGEIRERLGREVEPHDLLDRATVERQAELLRARAADGSGALVALRSGGGNVPLFLIHPAGGSPFSYLGLARRLGSEQPVYAFRDPYLSGDGGAFASLEEMAAAYVRELVAFRPEGPYALGGWSLGGMIAFEMACQLAAQGREVSLLLMLDTFRPVGSLARSWFRMGRAVRRKVLHAFGVGRLFSLLQGGGPLPPARRLLAIAYADYDCHDPKVIEATFPGLCDPAELRRLPPDERWEYVYRRLREEKLAREIPGVTAASLRRENWLFAVHHDLNDRYRPQRAYPGRITLFLKRGHANPLGWRRYTARPLEIREFDIRGTAEVPDPHIAMMQDANVDLYAEELRRLMAGVR